MVLISQKPLLIGEAPKEGYAILGTIGCQRNLDRLLGSGWRKRIEVTNLLDEVQEKEKVKGDAFDLEKAIAARGGLDWRLTPGRKVLLAGKRVASVFIENFSERIYFMPMEIVGKCSLIVIPHPTGINQWWNDCDAVRKASIVIRSFLNA